MFNQTFSFWPIFKDFETYYALHQQKKSHHPKPFLPALFIADVYTAQGKEKKIPLLEPLQNGRNGIKRKGKKLSRMPLHFLLFSISSPFLQIDSPSPLHFCLTTAPSGRRRRRKSKQKFLLKVKKNPNTTLFFFVYTTFSRGGIGRVRRTQKRN